MFAVAATGVPRHRADHAIAAARFAIDCSTRMERFARENEIVYGPDTSNLSLKIGIHSGPVTGGFLQGKGARFQLFGATVNTASQMQATGQLGKIQVSSETADLIIAAGKDHWLQKRDDVVYADGKGSVHTFWLQYRTDEMKTGEATNSDDSAGDLVKNLREISKEGKDAERMKRLIDWNVGVLEGIIKQIVARQNAASAYRNPTLPNSSITQKSRESTASMRDSVTSEELSEERMPLAEVKEIIVLPEFDRRIAKRQQDASTIELGQEVVEELMMFVTAVADMYKDNPFHNFAHASHVLMSMTKYMSRIVATTGTNDDNYQVSKANTAAARHDNTYGITSDPLTLFACVFSALIHDLDHPGVPNSQLVKENKALAATYQSRSVAEQNSFDLAWNLLMQDQFQKLRETICPTKKELQRFRGLVINAVMATDLGDKELKQLRNLRWDKAFSKKSEDTNPDYREDINRKATIVIEHLIQASDVSHTMQVGHSFVYAQTGKLAIAQRRISHILSFRPVHSIGTFISSGTRDYLWNCTMLTATGAPKRIQLNFGTKAKLASLTFICKFLLK